MLLRSIGLAAAALFSSIGVQAAYSSSGPNVMYYWGQNSAGGSSTQSSLATYCQSGQVDAVLLSFLHIFNVGGLPGLNFASACETYFEGTSTLNCPQIGADIKTCQSLGVKVILSLGGAAGSYGFTSDAQGQTFAQTIYDMFGPGSATYRPFGDAKIDGVDLDIEGGSSTGYAAFVNSVRSKFPSGFLVGAAPQCPFPDAILGSVINAVGFDYVNVQFYNNYCSAAGGSFNFDTWANWATGTSPNKNVKIQFTIPGSTTAAGSGYVPISTLQTIVPQLAATYPGVYGGVSIWDASQAWANSGFASSIYSLVKGSGGGVTTTKTTTTTKATTTTTTVVPTTNTSTKTTTTTTKTTTTTASTATATSGTCVAAGAACSTSGQYVCTSGGAYAVCDHNKWVVTSCPSGTVCIATTDGSSVYCGFATGSQTCSALNARALFRAILNKGGAIPKPYKGSSVIADFTVDSASATDFEAIVNARRTNATPFGKSVTIEFTAPSNVKYTQVDNGSIRQVGNNVRIQAKNAYNESMAIVVDVKGTVSSGIFVAPNPASIRIK